MGKQIWHRCAVVDVRPIIEPLSMGLEKREGQRMEGGRVGWEAVPGETAEGARVVDLDFFRVDMRIPAAKTRTTPPPFTADDETPCLPTGAGTLGAETAG
jgi:hypothetical protein